MPFGQDIAFLSIIRKAVAVTLRRSAALALGGEPLLTGEEVLHRLAVGHLQEAAARIRGQGGVGAVGQQDPYHIQVIVLHGIMNGPGITTFPLSEHPEAPPLEPAPLPRLPGAILSAAVDVGAIIQQVLNDGEPAAGARLVQGAVAGVVSVVDVTHSVLQAVEDHLLNTHTHGESRVHFLPSSTAGTAQGRREHAFAPVTLTSKNIHPHTRAHTHSQNVSQFHT